MSKPMTRVAVSVLICLVIAVMMFTIAYGASALGQAGGRAPANAGLTSSVVGLNRQPVVQVQSYDFNVEKSERGHNCESDAEFDD